MESSQVVIRRAGRSDVDLVLPASDLFATEPTAEWTQDFLDRGSNLLLLALVEGTPVGMLVAVETSSLGASPNLFVYGIRVREAHRGRGIAHQLIAKAVDVAEEAGCRKVWGSVDHGEEIAVDSPLSPPESVTSGATTFVIPLP